MMRLRAAPTALPAPRPVRLRITPWTVSSASEAARAVSAARRPRGAATTYSTRASGRAGAPRRRHHVQREGERQDGAAGELAPQHQDPGANGQDHGEGEHWLAAPD